MNLKEENQQQFEAIGENFKLLRERNGWSLEKLSEDSGIKIKVLSDIENGGDFGLEYLFKLCGIYGKKPKEIFTKLTM